MASPPRSASPDYAYIPLSPPLNVIPTRPVEKALIEIYEDNRKWFEEHQARQRELAKQRFTADVHRRQFENVYKYEPSLKKKLPK